MSFNVSENLAPKENPALQYGSGPIPTDVSSISEVTYQYQPDNGPGAPANAGEPNQYNDQDITFNIKIPASSRVLFDKSYIRLDGYGADMSVGITRGVPKGVSIPWNPIAAILQTAEVQLNESSDMTEQLNQEIGHGSMAKLLTRYSHEVLEEMDDFIFTPGIEDTRDLNTGQYVAPGPGAVDRSDLSAQAQLRRTRHLTDYDNSPIKHARNLYLSDLFDSLRIPAAFFLQRLKFTVHPKQSTQVLMYDRGYLAGLGKNYTQQRYFVTGAQLFLTMTTLTENQLVVEKEKILNNVAILRQSFAAFDARRDTHSSGKSYRDSNIKNMQAAMFMFPSNGTSEMTTIAGPLTVQFGSNPYQYVYANDNNDVGGISSYQHRYDGINSPNQPMTVDPLAVHKNTDLFHQYRLLTRRTSDREVTIALDFSTAMANERSDARDHCPYVLFCAQFYPLNAAGHKTMAGADHEIITSGGTAAGIIIVRIRNSFMEIRGDTSIGMIH